MKKWLTHKPLLTYYDVTMKTKVSTDACKESLRAVLLQMYGNDWKPVAYAARSMTSAVCWKKSYAMIEKELLGLVWGCRMFHEYIYGLDIVLETDHKPIVALSNKSLNDIRRVESILILGGGTLLSLCKYGLLLVVSLHIVHPPEDTLLRSFIVLY